jgi:hypothetical protein
MDALFQIALDQMTFLDSLPVKQVGFQGKELRLDQVINMVKRELTGILGFLDKGIAFAMKDMREVLDGARAAAAGAMTMEVYLALMPTLHARMFRNLVPLLWESVLNVIKGALGKALMPVMGAIGGPLGAVTGKKDGAFDKAFGFVDKAKQIVDRAKEAKDLIDEGFKASTDPDKDNLGKWRNLGRGLEDNALGGGTEVAVDMTFPFPSRKNKGTAQAIPPADYDSVEPEWKDDEAEDAEPQPPANGQSAAQ